MVEGVVWTLPGLGIEWLYSLLIGSQRFNLLLLLEPRIAVANATAESTDRLADFGVESYTTSCVCVLELAWIRRTHPRFVEQTSSHLRWRVTAVAGLNQPNLLCREFLVSVIVPRGFEVLQ